MIERTSAPKEGSVFSPTKAKGVEETFVAAGMRTDLPPCEHVEATFGDVLAMVSDLGAADDGGIRRDCHVLAGGVLSEFGVLELDGSVADGSVTGFRSVDAATIARIRRWAEGHGLDQAGPAETRTRTH